MVAPNDDELVFQIRAPADELKADLAESVAEVEKTKQKIEAIEAKVPVTVDATKVQADVEKNVAAVEQQVKAADAKIPLTVSTSRLKGEMAAVQRAAQAEADRVVVRIRSEIAPPSAEAEARARFLQTRGSAAAVADDDESGGGAVNAAARSLRQIGRVANIATAAIEGLDVAASGYELITASITGNYEDQVKAAKDAHDVVADIPIIGNKILKLGETINKYTIDQVTHEQEYVEKIKEATAEQERHTAVLTKHAKEKEKFNAEFSGFAEAVAGQGVAATSSEEEKAKAQIDAMRKRLADYLARPEAKDKAGNLTEAAKAFAAQTAAGISQIQAERAAKDERDTRAAGNELAAERADNEGNRDLAERIRLEEQRKEAEEAAAKRGAGFLANAKEQTAEAFRKLQLDQEARHEEERKKVVAESNKETDAKVKERDEREKQEASRAKEIDARQFDTEQNNLRSAGQNEQADLARIKHQAIADLRAAGGDAELQQAIEADVRSQLVAVETRAGRASAGPQTQVFSASQANLIGFNDPRSDARDTAKNTERANTILEQILTEARKPRAAVTV